MPRKDDDRLQLRIANKLSNIGLRAPCRIHVEVYNGSVSVKGMVQYEYQRRAALQAIRSHEGVHDITDGLKIEAPGQKWAEDDGRAGSGHVAQPDVE